MPETIGSSAEDQLLALAGLAGEVDLTSLLGTEAPSRESPSNALGAEVALDETQKQDLSTILCDLLDRYDAAMQGRNEMESGITDAHALRPDPATSGIGADASSFCSELVRLLTDQSAARIASTILGVTPLMRVTPIEGPDEDGMLSIALAKEAEKFLHEYTMRELGFDRVLRAAILRLCKVGTTVFKLGWDEGEAETWSYAKDRSEPQRKKKRFGRVAVELVPNRHVKIWPPTLLDWQRGYELVGHDSFMSRSQWRVLAASLGVSDEILEAVNLTPGGSEDFRGDAKLRAAGVDRQAIGQGQDLATPVQVTEIYCDLALPQEWAPTKFMAFLHRPTRRLLSIRRNPFFSQRHPYYPVRYLLQDELAWGDGVGHEVIQRQVADSAFGNIEQDSLKAGCYWVIKRRPSYLHQTLTDQVMPGQVLPTEDPAGDFIPAKIGGEVPELISYRERGMQAARESAGLPPVMSGMGDPTQKSGTGTGATLALMNQAGHKFASIDSTIRADLSCVYQAILELVAQYAPQGLFYKFASEESAETLKLLQYVPPRGEVGEMFKIWAQAPSAASSADARKQANIMIYQLMTSHLQAWYPQAAALVQQENPAALPRFTRAVLTFQDTLVRRLVEDYDLPGLKDQVPGLPKALPEDQLINNLLGQLQQAMQQIQQMQGVIQQAMGGQAPPRAEGGASPPAMPPPPPQPTGAPDAGLAPS